MPQHDERTGRFGGPGSSHQDRDHPGTDRQNTGHRHGGEPGGTAPPLGAPTNPRESRVSGGGGERDSRHAHEPSTS